MKRDPVSLVWLVGLALAVLFYLADPGLIAARIGENLSLLALRLDGLLAHLSFAAADMVRAAALALYAVFVVLCLLAIRRGNRGRAALVLVSVVFLALVGLDDAAPGDRRWAEALLLAAVAALVMTRRVRAGLPARLG